MASTASRASGAGVGRRVRAVAGVWGLLAVGTAAAVGVDAVAGRVDGRPAVYLLLVFLLPFWDRLPAGLPARLGVLAAVTAAIAAGWYALAALHDARWWPAVAFGLACAAAGTVPALRGPPPATGGWSTSGYRRVSKRVAVSKRAAGEQTPGG